MPTIIISDIEPPTEGRIYSEVIEGVLHVYVSASATVINDAGQRIRAEKTAELTTAAQKAAVQTILGAWKAAAKADWSIP